VQIVKPFEFLGVLIVHRLRTIYTNIREECKNQTKSRNGKGYRFSMGILKLNVDHFSTSSIAAFNDERSIVNKLSTDHACVHSHPLRRALMRKKKFARRVLCVAAETLRQLSQLSITAKICPRELRNITDPL
jgi:hypothetical protein